MHWTDRAECNKGDIFDRIHDREFCEHESALHEEAADRLSAITITITDNGPPSSDPMELPTRTLRFSPQEDSVPNPPETPARTLRFAPEQ